LSRLRDVLQESALGASADISVHAVRFRLSASARKVEISDAVKKICRAQKLGLQRKGVRIRNNGVRACPLLERNNNNLILNNHFLGFRIALMSESIKDLLISGPVVVEQGSPTSLLKCDSLSLSSGEFWICTVMCLRDYGHPG
jgi:hypothetical protein